MSCTHQILLVSPPVRSPKLVGLKNLTRKSLFPALVIIPIRWFRSLPRVSLILLQKSLCCGVGPLFSGVWPVVPVTCLSLCIDSFPLMVVAVVVMCVLLFLKVSIA